MPFVVHRRVPAALTVATLAGLLLSAPICEAQSTTVQRKELPTVDSLDAISFRGQLLAQYDQAAWIASDSVLARNPDPKLITSYVARQIGDRWAVAFGRLNAARDTFFIAYEAVQQGGNMRSFQLAESTPARAETGYYLRAARAIALAKQTFGQPPRPYNAAVIARPNGMLWVYLMPAQTQAGIYPLGGDVRYLVSGDGRLILATRELHRALIEYSAPPEGADKVEAGTHTAVLDDIPEDTDVFHVLVRQPRLPEYIVTDNFMWLVTVEGDIRFMGRRPESPKQ